MPQLALKVPIFRRWDKRFFVAVDSTLFETMPKIPTQAAGNAEVTWLVYSFARQDGGGYQMSEPFVQHTLWDDVLQALREGQPPERNELLGELTSRAKKRTSFRT